MGVSYESRCDVCLGSLAVSFSTPSTTHDELETKFIVVTTKDIGEIFW